MHQELFKNFPNVALYELDVTDFAQVEIVAQSVINKFGIVDVVVNNAGCCLMGPTETSSMEQIKRQFDTNVFGVFAVTKAFIPHFSKVFYPISFLAAFTIIAGSVGIYNNSQRLARCPPSMHKIQRNS